MNADPRTPGRSRPRWRQLLVLLLGAVGLVITLAGAWWIVSDLAVDDGGWDGLGVRLGIVTMAIGLPLLVAAVAAWRGRRMPTIVLWVSVVVVVAVPAFMLLV